MTKEEAIAYIKRADVTVGREIKTKTAEALDMAIKALEQKSKSEWEHDHEILKAYSDGANDILDKIKNEFIDRYPRDWANGFELGGRSCVFSLNDVLRIIDKYKEEGDG